MTKAAGASTAGAVAAPAWRRIRSAFPTGLYPRSLLIIITPVILLQIVVALVFMDRHYDLVTRQLAGGLARDIAALTDLYELGPERVDRAWLGNLARTHLDLAVRFLPPEQPPSTPDDRAALPWIYATFADAMTSRMRRPFRIEVSPVDADLVVRVFLEDAVMRVQARPSQAYASNSHIFIVWMFSTALVLLIIAVLFLRNQIRPILRLADAAEAFGKGRAVDDFRPRGAREVRRAAAAFLEMRSRIERQIEQRTAMLAGVSHDLRTILTRFRLQLALLEGAPGTDDLARDVDEMTRMLEAYLAFARGDAGEEPARIDVRALLSEMQHEAERMGDSCTIAYSGNPEVIVRPDAFKRCLSNLVTNAARFGSRVELTGHRDGERLTILVDDDGPGIRPEEREEVFRPFLRLDDARNQDHAGSGLGLAIARDIARGHGGEVVLTESPLCGLRAILTVPV